jgi:hypothetical protein
MLLDDEGRGGEVLFALLFSARRPWCWCDCDSMISEDNLIYFISYMGKRKSSLYSKITC